MTKSELIHALDGLMDETEIVIGFDRLSEIRDIMRVSYNKFRGDEPAFISLIARATPAQRNSEPT